MKITPKHIFKIIAPIVVCYGLHYFALEFHDNYLQQIPIKDLKAKNDIIANKLLRENFQTIILGDSSTAVSVMPSVLGRLTMNFSGWGTSSMDNYYVLKRYLSVHSPPGCILLSTSYNTDLHYQDKFWSIYIYSGFYSFEELSQIYKDSEEFKGYPSREMSYFEFMLKSAMTRLRLYNLPEVNFNKFVFGNKKTIGKYDVDLEKISDNRGFVGSNAAFSGNKLGLDSEVDFFKRGFIPFEAEDHYLRKIFELSNQNKVKVFFLPAPMASIPDVFSPEIYQEQLGEHIKKLMSSFPNMTYLNRIPVKNNKFSSLLHIAKEEAHPYTAILRKQMQERCILERY